MNVKHVLLIFFEFITIN